MRRINDDLTASEAPTLPTLADLDRRRAELIASLSPNERHAFDRPLAPPPPTFDADFDPDPDSQSEDAPAPPRALLPPVLGDLALQGLAGEAVQALAPHTEAHPAALLLQFLACFGNAVGRGPHCMVGAARHGLNLFVVLVGDSGKARKGTSWSEVARLWSRIDPRWFSRISTARLTARGLVHALRDQEPPIDRRLLVLCEEFAGVLLSLKRSAGQLSPLMRSAWDHGDLPACDPKNPVTATDTHISLIAHITQGELAQSFPSVEARNGFANRCLWVAVQRSRCLPEGGGVDQAVLGDVMRRLRIVLEWATSKPSMLLQRSAPAAELWRECYPELSQMQPGLRGAATSRAEAQVLRLSAIYALLDQTATITAGHLEAALAVWNYCSASAEQCFGFSVGDPVADRIREAIESSTVGLSRSKINGLFHGHVGRERIEAALAQLMEIGVLSAGQESTAGRAAKVWSRSQNPETPEASEA